MPLFLRWFCLFCLSFSLSLSFNLVNTGKSVAASFPVSIQASASASATPHGLVQAGKALYDDQRYAEANQKLSQAVDAYSEQGELAHQAQTLALQSFVLQKLGQWNAAQEVLDQGLSLLNSLANPPLRIQAQVFNAQGHLQFLTGQMEAALASWKTAEQDYDAIEELSGAIGCQINQMQALESLGLYHQADQQLTQIAAQLETLSDSALKVNALLRLGNVLRRQGEVARSQEHLKIGLAIAKTLDPSPMTNQLLGQLYLNLGNTERLTAARAISLNTRTTAQTHTQSALDYYQQAATTASLPLSQIEAQLNQLSLLIQNRDALGKTADSTNIPEIYSLISTISQTLPQLTSSRGVVYAQINFAHSLMRLDTPPDGISVPTILEQAIDQATILADERAIAYAMGTLGTWYETQHHWDLAKQLTATALQKAQGIRAADIAYQWQWQMGRIIQTEADAGAAVVAQRSKDISGKEAINYPCPQTLNLGGFESCHLLANNVPAQPTAIRYYTSAVETLNTLRADLVALNPDVQFSFREQVEPVYRELVELLLRETDPSQETLLQALDVIESLQLAELDNFFRNACAQPQAVTVSTVDANAAVLYPILLRDRLEVILQLPEATTVAKSDTNSADGPSKRSLFHVGHGFSNADVVKVATDLQRDLRVASVPTSRIKANSQQLYDWVIRPFEEELDVATNREESPVKTLTFVLDGSLRNLPMAVLHDGEHYLVERYAIAVTPGLQLLDPQPLKRQSLNVLLGGAVDAPSFERFDLGPLANVDRELEDISITVADTQKLKDQAFLQENIQTEVETEPFNVIHLATHGKFSSNPEQTFILDWEQPILAKDIDSLLFVSDPQRAVKNPIELLVLSACETASGDSRAALGLAGIAIRAGARSTLATLWQVNDASTAEFMVRFYQELSDADVTKAEALRNVQLSFLKADARTRFSRPNRWAPFILVGNWL